MDLLGIRRKRVDAAGNSVVETRADADHDITIMHRHIGFVGTVHAQHAEPVLARCRIGAETHQGRGDRETGQLYQFTQQTGGLRAGIDDAAAGVENRLLRLRHQLDGRMNGIEVALDLRLVALMLDGGGRRRVGAGGELDVLRNIDNNRSGTTRLRDAEGFMDNARQFVDVLHQPVVLGAGARDADGVAFLKRIGTDQRCRNLAGKADERDGIHQRILQRGDRIRRAGA
ncbi:hypothetical protein D3C78_1132420 [compost metagenome]